MLTLALYVALCSTPIDAFFPGYQALPNPEPDDCIIVPLENLDNPKKQEPISRA